MYVLDPSSCDIASVGAEHQGALQSIQLYNVDLTVAKRMLRRTLKEIKFHMREVRKIFLVVAGCSPVACSEFIIIVV